MAHIYPRERQPDSVSAFFIRKLTERAESEVRKPSKRRRAKSKVEKRK